MTTYWVFGKNVALHHIMPKGPMQAGVPQATSPSVQRQMSHHTSLAAVVYGMMQASKRSTNVNTTRKFNYLKWHKTIEWPKMKLQQFHNIQK